MQCVGGLYLTVAGSLAPLSHNNNNKSAGVGNPKQDRVLSRYGIVFIKIEGKRNARCVAVRDLFVLINVSKIKVRCSPVQFTAANEKKFNSRQQKKQKAMAL